MPTSVARVLPGLAIILLALCLGSCAARPASDRWLERAAKIHIYGVSLNSSVTVGAGGRISAQEPARDGGWLSPAEVKDLKSGISFGPPPAAFTACCIPRHAFLFYDKDGSYLGSLTVCFECGCTTLLPSYPPDPKHSYLYWDDKVFRRIALAHHLGPLASPDAGA